MNPLDRMAEARIEEALERGQLAGLPGLGKPLRLEDLSGVAPELVGGYLLLKGAGYLPEEAALRKECSRLADLIAAAVDAEERSGLARARRSALLRLELLRERRGGNRIAAVESGGLGSPRTRA